MNTKQAVKLIGIAIFATLGAVGIFNLGTNTPSVNGQMGEQSNVEVVYKIGMAVSSSTSIGGNSASSTGVNFAENYMPTLSASSTGLFISNIQGQEVASSTNPNYIVNSSPKERGYWADKVSSSTPIWFLPNDTGTVLGSTTTLPFIIPIDGYSKGALNLFFNASTSNTQTAVQLEYSNDKETWFGIEEIGYQRVITGNTESSLGSYSSLNLNIATTTIRWHSGIGLHGRQVEIKGMYAKYMRIILIGYGAGGVGGQNYGIYLEVALKK